MKQTSAKGFKIIHDWARQMIHWELRKKLKFDHYTKWYTHKPESVLDNEMDKIIWNFEIQTAHQIPARRADRVIIDKKKERISRIVDFAVPVDHRVKIKKAKRKKSTWTLPEN